MLFPITATMELFNSFETSFQLLYQNPVTKKITNGFWRGEGQGVGAAKVRKI